MKITAATAFALLSGLAAASDLPSASQVAAAAGFDDVDNARFLTLSANMDDEPNTENHIPALDREPINAYNGTFWVGLPTTSYCSEDDDFQCPDGKVTSVMSCGSRLVMGSTGPTNQDVFIDPSNGAMSYAQAEDNWDIPNGANITEDKWVRSDPKKDQKCYKDGVLQWGKKNQPIYFCSHNAQDVKTGPWQVYVNIPGTKFGADCVKGTIDIHTTKYATAWQYC